MTHTSDELRAAISDGAHFMEAYTNSGKSAAILRAHLESFDEERAFLGIAEKHCAALLRFSPDYDSDFTTAYRALVAKREGK